MVHVLAAGMLAVVVGCKSDQQPAENTDNTNVAAAGSAPRISDATPITSGEIAQFAPLPQRWR